MQDLIKNWREFMKEWSADHSHRIRDRWGVLGELSIKKPEFYDFMEWLAKVDN